MHLTSISLDPQNKIFKNYTNENNFRELVNVSKINILIGSNNSGKSRLMREIIIGLSECLKENENKELVISKFRFNKTYSLAEVLSWISDLSPLQNIGKQESRFTIKELKLSNQDLFEVDLKKIIKEIRNYYNPLQVGIEQVIPTLELRIKNKIYNDFISNEFLVTYIPILRSLKNTNSNKQKIISQNNYEGYSKLTKRVVDDYFPQHHQLINIFSGEDIYDDVKNLLLSDETERQKLKEFELFLEESFFKKKVNLIPRIKNVHGKENFDLYIKIGNEIERPIFELGDGIQTIIICTFPLFIYKDKKHYLFIEEPESNLHPGLQTLLMKTFNDPKFVDTQVFFTTHSSHFLEMSYDNNNVSVYSFHKEFQSENHRDPKFIVKNVSYGDQNLLKSLGINNSSVFLANCTIWVEGITDRLYIKKFLQLYFEENNIQNRFENLHFAFVEYAGSNLTHWEFGENETETERIFAKGIANNIFLIADSDNSESKKKKSKQDRHEKLQIILKKHFHLLDSKEIENLLSPKVLIDVICKYESKIDSTINSENIEFKNKESFTMVENIPIYANEALGEYIDQNLKGRQRKGSYADGNTISDKVNFCNYAIESMHTWDDLTLEAKELTEKVYLFIEDCNSQH